MGTEYERAHYTHRCVCERGGWLLLAERYSTKSVRVLYLCRSYIFLLRAPLPKMFQKNVTAAISFDFWPPTEEALRIQRERCAVQAFLLSLYAIYTVRSRARPRRREYHPHTHTLTFAKGNMRNTPQSGCTLYTASKSFCAPS